MGHTDPAHPLSRGANAGAGGCVPFDLHALAWRNTPRRVAPPSEHVIDNNGEAGRNWVA
jgi:hypothetical protein